MRFTKLADTASCPRPAGEGSRAKSLAMPGVGLPQPSTFASTTSGYAHKQAVMAGAVINVWPLGPQGPESG